MKRVFEESFDAFGVSWQVHFNSAPFAHDAVIADYPALPHPVHAVFFQTPASIFETHVVLTTSERVGVTNRLFVTMAMIAHQPLECRLFPDCDYRLQETTPGVFLGFLRRDDGKEARPHLRIFIEPETHVLGSLTLLRDFYTDDNRAFMLTKSKELMPRYAHWCRTLELASLVDQTEMLREEYKALVEKAKNDIQAAYSELKQLQMNRINKD